MVNVTVIKGKDAVKYLVRIIVVSFLIFILSRYFVNLKETDVLEKVEKEENLSFISCLEETLPQAKQIQINNMQKENMEETEETEESKKEKDVKPIKTILNSQLSFLENIEKKDYNIEKLAKDESSSISYENDNRNEKINNASDYNIENIEQAKANLTTEVIPNSVPNKYTNTYNGVQIKNESGLEINENNLNFDLSFNKKDILIFHTHTCESYTSSEKYSYEQTGSFRTTDLNFSVARVGDELTSQLNSYGFNVSHDKTYHDYPAYSGSYARSLTTVQNILNSGSKADVVIDIHRDAIADSSYAPKVKIGEEYASQLMFVIGTNGSGLEHPNWIQNLKFAIMVQQKANEMYPGLFKPIVVRSSRYNQHLTKCSSIIEVGATGNTLDEANTSMKYLAKVLSEVIR